jgi:hypothetical protein
VSAVPLRLSLPASWLATTVGRDQGTILAAVRPMPAGEPTPSLAVRLLPTARGEPVAALADRALGRLARASRRLVVIDERRWGRAGFATVLRTVRYLPAAAPDSFAADAYGTESGSEPDTDDARWAIQTLLYRGLPAPDDGAATHGVFELVLSCAAAQLPVIAPELRDLLDSASIGEPPVTPDMLSLHQSGDTR